MSGSDDKTVRVWDVQAGWSVMDPLVGHSYGICSVAFSPDGRYIVSGSFDDTVRLWDALTGHSMGDPFKGHDSAVLSVVFSPDGTHIASGSADNTIRLWDAQTGCTNLNPSVSSVLLSSTLLPSEVRNNVNDTGIHHSISHIFKGKPVIFYPSETPSNWMMGEDSKSYLFWVPPSNRWGLFFPRTSVLKSS